MFIFREAQRANSISYKHNHSNNQLTVFEMQCIFEIEESVILVQSYKHLLYSRKGLCFRPPPLCSASSGFLDLLCCWRLRIESSVAMAFYFSPQRDCRPRHCTGSICIFMVHREAGWVWKQIFLHIIIQNYLLLIQEIKCLRFLKHFSLIMRYDIIILLLYNKLNELLYFKKHWQFPFKNSLFRYILK